MRVRGGWTISSGWKRRISDECERLLTAHTPRTRVCVDAGGPDANRPRDDRRGLARRRPRGRDVRPRRRHVDVRGGVRGRLPLRAHRGPGRGPACRRPAEALLSAAPGDVLEPLPHDGRLPRAPPRCAHRCPISTTTRIRAACRAPAAGRAISPIRQRDVCGGRWRRAARHDRVARRGAAALALLPTRSRTASRQGARARPRGALRVRRRDRQAGRRCRRASTC